MKNSISLLSVYLFIILGFLFHTSAHPAILGKYTIKYVFLVGAFIIIFPMLLILVQKISSLLPKRYFFIYTVIFFILLLSLSEIYLRIKYRNYESTYYTSTIDNFNPFLQSQLAKTDNLHINSLGFRGEEIQTKKPAGTFRIVVLGGSTVLNREVTYEKNAVRVLEKKLRLYYPQKKIEVINAGQSGYNTEHSIILYMFKIRDMQPDLVIMWHGINDMGQSCLMEGLTHGNYKSDYSHEYGALAHLVFSNFQPQPIVQIKIVSFDFLVKAIRDNVYSDITNKIQDYILLKQAENYITNKNTIIVHDYPSIDAYKRNLSYLIVLTKNDSIPLILGNQPNLLINNPTVKEAEKISFPRPFCIKDNKNYSFESLHYGITLFNTATKQIAETNGTDFVDLDSKVPKNLSYFFDSVHYTEKGNAIIADTLFKEIIDKNFIH